MQLKDSRGLMLALDTATVRESVGVLEAARESVDAVKIGSVLLSAEDGGPQIISLFRSFELPVLVDWKLFDAPHIVVRTVANLVRNGAESISVYASAGIEVLTAVRRALPGTEVVWMTGRTYVTKEDAAVEVQSALRAAEAIGVSCMQVPGNYPDLVRLARRNLGCNACLLACGIGAQGGMVGDAIRAGANYEIVGRHIYDSLNPAESAAEFKAELQSAFVETA